MGAEVGFVDGLAMGNTEAGDFEEIFVLCATFEYLVFLHHN